MPKKLIGIVTSDVQDKTIVLTVTSRQTHPIYGKQYTVSRKYTSHDANNEAKKGDRVEVVECRPFSKNKTWNLVRVIETGHADVELKADDELLAPAAAARAEKADEEAEKENA
jgi:small subunit ribosomal protein S17